MNGKANVPYHGILLGLKIEGNSDDIGILTQMNLEDTMPELKEQIEMILSL